MQVQVSSNLNVKLFKIQVFLPNNFSDAIFGVSIRLKVHYAYMSVKQRWLTLLSPSVDVCALITVKAAYVGS